ncbi:MAG: site-specific DNA-methyltransferase, partial [Chloroflexi bacterium]|nr:site-specific DNA-methyltransferase [Chloroflexota bacterium]
MCICVCGDTVLDFFAGSGTTGAAAHECGRSFVLIDDNPQAIAIMRQRFRDVPNVSFHGPAKPESVAGATGGHQA